MFIYQPFSAQIWAAKIDVVYAGEALVCNICNKHFESHLNKTPYRSLILRVTGAEMVSNEVILLRQVFQ